MEEGPGFWVEEAVSLLVSRDLKPAVIQVSVYITHIHMLLPYTDGKHNEM